MLLTSPISLKTLRAEYGDDDDDDETALDHIGRETYQCIKSIKHVIYSKSIYSYMYMIDRMLMHLKVLYYIVGGGY
jgi:hypothetical protein